MWLERLVLACLAELYSHTVKHFLYISDIDPHEVRDKGYTKWLDMLDSFLKETIASKYTYKRTTRFAVQFLYDGKIDVDLLVSPYWGEVPQPLYRFLENEVRPKERFR